MGADTIGGTGRGRRAEKIAAIGKLELYYDAVIDGGVYKDNLVIDGGNITDNAKGLRNLTQDSVHRSIVRSQYDD